MKNREAKIERKTNETDISISLNLDGTGKRGIETPVGFLNHMLDLFAKHGLFDFAVKAKGDTYIDEVLATTVVDFAGRYAFCFKCDFTREKVGDLSTELVYDFCDAFAQNAKVNLFIKVENGRNDHHKIEAIFKAVARSIRMAVEFDRRSINQIPSTKGKL